MSEGSHPDPIEQLRYALWGVVDAQTEAVGQHVGEEGCGECHREIRAYQGIREVVGEAEMAVPSPGVLNRVRDAVVQEAGTAAEIEWLRAEPVLVYAGYRAGPDDDLQFVCVARDLHLDAVLHAAGQPQMYAVTGHVLDSEKLPVADIPVTLIVDLRPSGTTRTNTFGEFDFDPRRGTRFGVRIGDEGEARHVTLWEGEARS